MCIRDRQMGAMVEGLKGWQKVGENVTLRSAAHEPDVYNRQEQA